MGLNMFEVLQGLIALITLAVGVTGLLGESWPRRMLETWTNIHALFALLLCCLMVIRCRWCVTYLGIRRDDRRGLSRQLSRVMCLLVCMVLGTKEVLGILNSIWHHGAVEFSVLDASILNGPDRPGWNPHEDFQLFIASALLALVFVRVLILISGRRVR